MRKIAIVSGKGGIGKTTLSINLSYLLHNKFNLYTAVVDCNITTPHLSICLGTYGASRTLNHVLLGRATAEEAILEHPTGLRILPASTELKDLDGVDISRLGEVLGNSSSNLILDSAPGIGREGVAAIAAADEILFVTHPNLSAVSDIHRCSKVAEGMNKKVLGVVVNCRKNMRHELSDEEIERMTEISVIAEIPYDLDVERSMAASLPLEIYNINSKVNQSFYKICSLITGTKFEKPKGIIERIFGSLKIKGK